MIVTVCQARCIYVVIEFFLSLFIGVAHDDGDSVSSKMVTHDDDGDSVSSKMYLCCNKVHFITSVYWYSTRW
jgi:hypothetical protein